MRFAKRYWYLILLSILPVGLGITAYLTSLKLKQEKSVSPTAPEEKPAAAEPACTLSFTIASPTPTPTGTPAATATPTPTSTPTPTPSPSPTSAPNTDPQCTGLSVNPNTGTQVPFETTLTCSGIDVDGDITAAEFILGDGQTQTVQKNVGSPGSLSLTYRYTNRGTYTASCRVRDNNQKFSTIPDSCQKTVTVTAATGGGETTYQPPTAPPMQPTETLEPTAEPTLEQEPQPTAQPTPKIPVAGTGPSVLGATIISGGLLLLLLGLTL